MIQGKAFLRKIRASVCALFLVAFAVGRPDEVRAAIDWPTLGFTEVLTNAFSHPVCITHAGDGSQRLFVVQQAGLISIIQNSNLLTAPFLNITNHVFSAGAEQGLLGLAFPPGFPTVNHFYVDYTIATNNSVVISRFQLSSTNANVADTNSEQIILTIPKPYNNHNAGQLAFGPDGYLYIAIGDGGSEGDPKKNGQNTSNLLSKILRIDVESGASPYAVPTNNPFVGNTNYAPETWAYGLRNPWRFSFDRMTGDLYIGDVGQNIYEEIDFQPAGLGGQNYGWSIMEGPSNYSVPTGFTNFASLTLPVAWYNHNILPTDEAGAVIGGYVYRGPSQPRMDGMYFYGDFSSGWMWGLKQDSGQWQSLTLTNPAGGQFRFAMSTFGEDDLGQLYMADYNRGVIYQMYDSQQTAPPLFSVPSGTLITSNLVTVISGSTNAEIHWTTNGIDPTLSDPLVPANGIVQVSNGLTNKARAYRADLSPSTVTAVTYTLQVATPVLSPGSGAVTNPTPVTITTTTPNANIYYRTDGGFTPTTNSPLYSGPVILQKSTGLTAIGICPGYQNSSVVSGTYTMNQTGSLTVTPTSGQVTYGTQISISCATPGSTILYTLDGTNPSTNSLTYSNPIPITRDTTLIVIGSFPGYANSGPVTNTYRLPQSPPPVFVPPVGPLTNGAQIAISSGSTNAVIYYTLDGSVPTTNSTIYIGPLTFTNQMTLSAKVLPFNMDLSNAHTNFYGLQIMEQTVVTTIAGQVASGYSNAIGANALFSGPLGICLDNLGNLYVADSRNNVLRQISPSGNVTTFAGDGVSGIQLGAATNAEFTAPVGVCVDIAGNIYVGNLDSCDSILQIDTNQNVTLWCSVGSALNFCQDVPSLSFLAHEPGTNTYVYSGIHGLAIRVPKNSADELTPPSYPGWGLNVGVSLDSASNLYVAAGFGVWMTASVQGGNVSLLAGGSQGYSDQRAANALFEGPQDTAVDTTTNILVTDITSVRKVHANGQVTTVAGTGTAGYRNGPGSVAQFNGASGLCIDTNGNIYVADSGNNCIRKISPDTAGIGIADDWQLAHFGYIGIDPNADPDHDGMSNFEEFWAGTDPLDPNSVLRIQTASLITNGSAQISWQTVAGKGYTVQYSTDLINWNNLVAAVLGNGSLMTVSDPGTISQNGQRYYRIDLTAF